MNKHLQRFLNEKVAVRVRTKDEWIHFMEILEKETDARWYKGERPTEFEGWDVEESKTSIVYEFEGNNGMQYSPYDLYEAYGYEIVEFKDLLKEEESMTLAEKLRFLADRAEDGKDFYWGGVTMKFDSKGTLRENMDGEWIYSDSELNDIDYLDIKIKPQWTFTEDEKVILRNLGEKWKYIARDRDEALFIYDKKPVKDDGEFLVEPQCKIKSLSLYEHLFQSIQWSDEEACEFREYL